MTPNPAMQGRCAMMPRSAPDLKRMFSPIANHVHIF